MRCATAATATCRAGPRGPCALRRPACSTPLGPNAAHWHSTPARGRANRLQCAASAEPSTSSSAPSPSAPPSTDVVLRTLSENTEVSVLCIDGTQLVRDACERHGTAPTASAALGRALLAGLLMAAFKGEGEATQITFQGTGPLGGLMVVAESTGFVKGRVDNPAADPPLRPDGKLDVGAAVGGGVLAVVRSKKGGGDPYTGLTEIVSGEVGEDIAHYLSTSEQTNCALGLGVTLDRAGVVVSAGGFLVQPLPLCSEATLSTLEQNIGSVKSVSGALADGAGADGLASTLLAGLGASSSFRLTPRYGPCDTEGLRERMIRAAALLGEEEVRAAAEAAGGDLEMTCEFCRNKLRIPVDEVMAELARVGEE